VIEEPVGVVKKAQSLNSIEGRFEVILIKSEKGMKAWTKRLH